MTGFRILCRYNHDSTIGIVMERTGITSILLGPCFWGTTHTILKKHERADAARYITQWSRKVWRRKQDWYRHRESLWKPQQPQRCHPLLVGRVRKWSGQSPNKTSARTAQLHQAMFRSKKLVLGICTNLNRLQIHRGAMPPQEETVLNLGRNLEKSFIS